MDINEAMTQRQQLYVTAYLASLRPEASSARSQIIYCVEVPTLMEAYFRVIHVAKVVGINTSDTPADRAAMDAIRSGFRRSHGARRGGRKVGRDGGQSNISRDGG